MNANRLHHPVLHRRQIRAGLDGCRAYLLGALHDGTAHGTTFRISQREEEYVLAVRELIVCCGGRAWTYREGRSRELYVVEFSRSFLGTPRVAHRFEMVHFARGYFDAEGGIPSQLGKPPYLYFAQKNRKDLSRLKGILCKLGIACGEMHNPSKTADPEYWRFYVRRASHARFARVVGSWHPRKSPLLEAMVTGVRDRFQPDYSEPVARVDSP